MKSGDTGANKKPGVKNALKEMVEASKEGKSEKVELEDGKAAISKSNQTKNVSKILKKKSKYGSKKFT